MSLHDRQNRSWHHHRGDRVRGLFNKLSEMMGRIVNYLDPLGAHTKSTSDSTLVEDCLVGVYTDLVTFFRQYQVSL